VLPSQSVTVESRPSESYVLVTTVLDEEGDVEQLDVVETGSFQKAVVASSAFVEETSSVGKEESA